MDALFPQIDLYILTLAILITLLAGVVKGVVGFALPMVMISGLTLIMPPEIALAALILPTLVANLTQALRLRVGYCCTCKQRMIRCPMTDKPRQ
jgi:uncharacterized membrane protein YfcA